MTGIIPENSLRLAPVSLITLNFFETLKRFFGDLSKNEDFIRKPWEFHYKQIRDMASPHTKQIHRDRWGLKQQRIGTWNYTSRSLTGIGHSIPRCRLGVLGPIHVAKRNVKGWSLAASPDFGVPICVEVLINSWKFSSFETISGIRSMENEHILTMGAAAEVLALALAGHGTNQAQIMGSRWFIP